MNITLVTTTRNRSVCFDLLQHWISKQTVKPYQWIVVNDGTEPYNYLHNQQVIKRKPKPDEQPWQSILNNWLAAIPKVKGDHVIVCEDDDYYREDYLYTVSRYLEAADIFGFSNELCYKLPTRRFTRPGNLNHASLAATGFRKNVLPCLEKVIKEECTGNKSVFIDMYLWVVAPYQYNHLHLLKPQPEERAYHVGFKNMPGAKGLGIYHSDPYNPGCTFDGNWSWLDKWLGSENASLYKRFWKEHFSHLTQRQ